MGTGDQAQPVGPDGLSTACRDGMLEVCTLQAAGLGPRRCLTRTGICRHLALLQVLLIGDAGHVPTLQPGLCVTPGQCRICSGGHNARHSSGRAVPVMVMGDGQDGCDMGLTGPCTQGDE